MRYSDFYVRTRRTVTKQDSINAYLLEKAGFINQIASGVYALMPLAVRSLHKIEQIIREEMNTLGASEVLFSALQPQKTWEQSGRWQDPSFRQIIYTDSEAEMTLGATHEEPMAIVVKQGVQSYRDLPVLLYQFQTKFRKEMRPKSGLLRGREFRMKDLYSFHPDEKSHSEFYELAARAYSQIFSKFSLQAYRTWASGGVFSQDFSDEFQVLCETGEDEVWINHKTKMGYNSEVASQIPGSEKKNLELAKSIEVGNIFHLGTKYADAFNLQFLTATGERRSAVMGSYGIGTTRLLGTLAEVFNDENGLMLPQSVAPFEAVVIDLTESKTGAKIAENLEKVGIDVLLDDRDEPAGMKLVEADLIGYPVRVVYSQKTAQDGKAEIKQRGNGKLATISLEELAKRTRSLLA